MQNNFEARLQSIIYADCLTPRNRPDTDANNHLPPWVLIQLKQGNAVEDAHTTVVQ